MPPPADLARTETYAGRPPAGGDRGAVMLNAADALSARRGPHVVPQPSRDVGFDERAVRQRQPGGDLLVVTRQNLEAVQGEEGQAHDQRCPLVAVDEGVVAREAEGIGAGQGSQVRLVVGEEVDGPVQRAVQPAMVPDTGRAAVSGQLVVVDRQRHRKRYPLGLVHALPGQFPQNRIVVTHDTAGDPHLPRERLPGFVGNGRGLVADGVHDLVARAVAAHVHRNGQAVRLRHHLHNHGSTPFVHPGEDSAARPGLKDRHACRGRAGPA